MNAKVKDLNFYSFGVDVNLIFDMLKIAYQRLDKSEDYKLKGYRISSEHGLILYNKVNYYDFKVFKFLFPLSMETIFHLIKDFLYNDLSKEVEKEYLNINCGKNYKGDHDKVGWKLYSAEKIELGKCFGSEPFLVIKPMIIQYRRKRTDKND